VLAATAITCPTSFRRLPWRPGGSTAHTSCCLATYSLVHRYRHLWYFLALDPSYVPPHSVVVAGIVITSIQVMNILVRSDLLSSSELYSAVLSKKS
jgi:hypothetical protein